MPFQFDSTLHSPVASLLSPVSTRLTPALSYHHLLQCLGMLAHRPLSHTTDIIQQDTANEHSYPTYSTSPHLTPMPYPSSSSKPNRSILKCPSPQPQRYTQFPSSSDGTIPAPTPPLHCSVRFPSSPKLSTIHYTHCPTMYDRRPIEVSQNTCAMPERQCDGLTNGSPSPWTGKHVHPSVLNRMYEAQMGFMPPPALSSDDGSSEDSG